MRRARLRSPALPLAGLLAVLLTALQAVVGVGPAAGTRYGSTAPQAPAAPTWTGAPTHQRASAAADGTGDVLGVEIASVTPSALRPGARLEVTGSVTNVDDHVWREVKAYLVISPSPMTSSSELAAAANSPPESYIGDRILDFGSFARLGRLLVGQASTFSLDVPWHTLPISGAEGVYSVGVQVLATDVDGTRDQASLARARTFIPLVSTSAGRPAPVDLGLLWPLREPVLRRSNGSYVGAERLRSSLDVAGRLRRLVDLATSAGVVPVSLVADPALLDAAKDLADGDYGPPRIPTTSGQAESGSGATDGTAADTAAPEPSAPAGDWLQDVTALLGATGFRTGYGEPDAAAAAAPRLEAAIGRAGRATANTLLDGVPRILALPSPAGADPESAGPQLGSGGDQVVVLSPAQLADWDPSQGVALDLPTATGTLPALVADPALAAGGPQPGDPHGALQMRQRLLAETALMSIDSSDGARQSALFVPPRSWDPGPSWPTSDFFGGLRTQWLRPVPVDTLLSGATAYTGFVTAPPVHDHVGAVPSADLVEAASRLARRARTLSRLTGGGRAVTNWYDAAAALGVSSYGTSADDGAQRLTLTRQTAAVLGRQLDQVTLDGPSFVTLSSSRGRFGVTITNGLDRAVTVGVRVDAAAAGLQFDAGDPVTVGPGQRQTVTVDARVGDNRVTSARAYLVTREGQRFGRQLSFNVRTSVVGMVVWVVVGVAALLLLVAIVRRVALSVRRRPTTRGQAAGP